MDIKTIIKNNKIGKEKIFLLALAGILLLFASYFENVISNKGSEETTTVTSKSQQNYQEEMEKKVAGIISKIKGVSNVSVVVSLKTGKEEVLQQDSENSQENSEDGTKVNKNSTQKKNTVVFGQDGNDNPYVVKEIYPQIEGIAVIAKGLSSSESKEEIINMLVALFNVPMHKVSVMSID